MPGLLRSQADSTSFLGQMKVSVSRSYAPKQIHSTINSRAISISLEKASWDGTDAYPALVNTAAGSAGRYQPTLTINDLPPEILAEIFHIYLFWEDESDLIDPELEGLISVIEPSSRAAPLLFCQICSYWRNVAISTPSLWSSIALKENLKLDTVKLWLQRSRNHPFSFAVWLSSSTSGSRDKLKQWPELLGLLRSSIRRWRDVLVHVPIASNLQPFMDTLLPPQGESPAAMLRSLDVSNDSYGEQISEETIGRLSSFPHHTLRRLNWEGETLPRFRELDTIMWRNIQQLSFVKVEAHILFSFLEACPNVLFINAGTLLTRADTTLLGGPITATKLQTLHIRGAGGDFTEALQRLVAPQLKMLSFNQSGRGYMGATGRLLDFLAQSQCRLTSLSAIDLTECFNEGEARDLLLSKTITDIPNVSIRMRDDLCHPSFPQTIVSEASAAYRRTRTYAYSEPLNYCYHLGWGIYDFTRDYARYPFLRKGPVPKPKWFVFMTNGPSTFV